MYESLLILLFRQYYAVKIAADEIAENDACIYSKYLQSVEFPERNRHAEIIECIRHAVGEAAYDEERHTEEKRQVLLLAGKLYCCGHDESASYAKKSAIERSGADAAFKDPLSRGLDLERSHSRKKRSYEAAYDVSEEDQEKLADLPFVDESGCTCIKFQFIAHYGQESEREEDGTCKGSISLSLNACSQETEASGSDSDTGEY